MVHLAKVFACLIAMSLAPLAAASQPPLLSDLPDADQSKAPANMACVHRAASAYSIPNNVMLAIASIERGKNGQVVQSPNGTVDLGHFQINSIHFKPGGDLYKSGIGYKEILENGCYNAYIAAWMLSERIKSSKKQSFWAQASDYHSRTPKFNSIYRDKLIRYSIKWGRWLETQPDKKFTIVNKR